MNASRRVYLLLVSIVVVLLGAQRASAQCVSLTTLGSPSTQNFVALANAGTNVAWTDNSTIPGWYATRTTYNAGTGSSNTGAMYSFGVAGVNPLTDRALGGVGSGGTGTFHWAGCFTNNTGAALSSVDIAYIGEQWRDGLPVPAAAQTITFEFQVAAPGVITDADTPATGWTAVPALDFTGPIIGTAAVALDGNAAPNRTARAANIPAAVPVGNQFWVRWRDINDASNDHGLAIDDFSITPNGAVVLPNLTVTDVSQVETNAGTTFTFQVNLSAPAGPGGVTFDIATADGTAQDDTPAAEDNDYVAQSLTPPASTIAAGNSSFAFNVTVNGDLVPESNENFFVNVTNVTGANVTDGQGEGTITNDDAACATLNIDDVTQVETNAGTTTFAFTVSLSQAGCGTVTFDIATADGTAEDDTPATEDNDYVAQSLTGQTITFPATYTFNVTVNGDGTAEPDQTFFVNITNVSPANVQVGDPQGLGTIVNDDFNRIHDVQGNGTASPLVGQTVTMRGIVTLLKSNGFFLQEELADIDADPNTSEGIFVFTSTPPTAAVGDEATVTGTVVEFNGLTEISPVTSLTINSTGNTLPVAITLTLVDLPTTANFDQPQLEKYEGMRLLAASLTTVAHNDNFFDTDTVLTAQPRPFREPGIPVSDPVPPDPTSGLPDPNIPIWDENPERLSVDTNGRAGSTGETLTSNVTLTNVAGPLDFSFGRYRIINETNLTRTANMSAVPVPLPAADEFTITGYNIENFNNNATQRQKAALTVRDVLRLPDIIGTIEIFDLADLQALATEIQTISGIAYSSHLIEQDGTSEDSDQDVGFLVKTSRVSVTSVTQERAADTFINPNTSLPELLHDRPPLLLTATVDPSGPNPQPVLVIVNHLRSFIDVELVAGEGVRVRAKRKAQAESLGDLLNDLQTANPGTPVISVGDYNAFQFNSGYDDSISVLKGMPTPDDQIVVDQSPDVVNPDFRNLLEDVPADQRYSFIFENTAQSLDHVLVNTAADAINTGIVVARVNSDFPSIPAAAFASDAGRPEANSDHDPVVSYFQLQPPGADLVVTKTDSPDPVTAGTNLTYTITVANNGPDAASTSSWSDTLPAGTTFVSLPAVAGWSCTTPAVGATGTVSCTNPSFGVGSSVFTLTVAVDPSVAAGTILSNTATATSATTEGNPGDESDTETTTVATSADLQISKTDTPDPVDAGSNISYQITITNAGPSNAATASFSDTLPAGTTFVSLSTTGPWSCTTPAVGATGTVSCTNPSFGVTVDFFTLVVAVDPSVAAGTIISNTATMASATSDPNTGNESSTATTTVASSADLSVTKSDSPDPVNAGANLTYTITVNNAGPSDASTVTLTDILPAEVTFFSLSSPAGWSCTTPAIFTNGTVSCSAATVGLGNHVFTLVVHVATATTAGTVINNSATVATNATPDPNSGNETGSSATTVTTNANLVVTKSDSPDPVNAGSNITYSILLNNAGPSNAASLNLSDTLPAGTTFVSLTSPGSFTCTTPAVGATGTVSCNHVSSMVPGSSVTFTLVVQVDPSVAAGTVISNDATATSTTPDPTPGNETGSASTTVATAADLSVTKSDSPDPINAGANLTYTITVNNAGSSNATTVNLSDTVPADTTFFSLSSPGGWSCTTPGIFSTGNISCSIASLGVGNAVFTLVVNVNSATASGTVISNTATVSSATSDPNTGNESSTATTTVTTSANLVVTKTDSPDPVSAGNNITYTIGLANNGPSNAAINLSDTLPAGTTFVSLVSPGSFTCTTPAVGATGTVSCNHVSTMVGGASVNFTLVVNVDPSLAAGTVISNTATATTTTPDPTPGNESATATTTVGTGSADMSVTKVDTPDPVTAGNNITYTITVTNAGPSNATTAALSDTLPAGTTFVSLSSPGGWSCTTPAVGGTGTVNCSNPSMTVGSAVFTLVVNVNASVATGTVISNSATASSATTDPNPGNENATATTTVATSADLSISKTDTPDPVNAGSNISYQITITNAGPSNAATASFSDTLPAGTTFVSLSTTGPWSCTTPAVGATGTVSCTNPSFGVTVDFFTLVVAVDASVAAGTVLSNTATMSSATTDPNSGNNSSTATTTVAASADLSVTKVDTPDPVTAGNNITYTITVNNAGPSDAATATLADTLPAGTTFVSLSAPGGWLCTTPAVGATGAVNCSIASMSVGSNVFTLVVAVDPSVTDGTIITNSATAASTTPDPNTGNETGTATTTVSELSADLSVTKTDSPDPVMAGANLTYTITVDNAGPDAAPNATLDDTLPASTTFVSLAAPAGWSCTTPAVGAAGAINCSNASMAMGNAVFTLTVAVDANAGGGTVLSNTAIVSSGATDATPANNSDTETTSVLSPATLTATKTAPGSVPQGSNVTYTIVISNSGPAAQSNNPGDEFVDVLPSQLTLISANATSGTALANLGTNTVTWNGSIPAGGSVTITIQALVEVDAPVGSTITNQGTVNADTNGDGTNEPATALTDDPSAAGSNNGTAFVVGAPATLEDIPALDPFALAALATLLAAAGILLVRRS